MKSRKPTAEPSSPAAGSARRCSGECDLPGPCCDATAIVRGATLQCTRMRGHKGRHEACGQDYHPGFAWPNAEQQPRRVAT